MCIYIYLNSLQIFIMEFGLITVLADKTRVITRWNVFRTNVKCAAGWRSCDAAQWFARILLDWSVKHNNKSEEIICRYTGVWYGNIFGLFILWQYRRRCRPLWLRPTLYADHLCMESSACIEMFKMYMQMKIRLYYKFSNLA